MKKSILTFVAAAAITGTAGANVQAEEVTVKKGDTLWDFSQSYNAPVDMIKEWNGLSSNIIHPDDVLNVYPEKKYIVSKGDTLWDIAREHNVTAEAIKEWNSLSSELIRPDDELILYPEAKAVNAAAAPAKSEQPAETVPAAKQKSDQPAVKQTQPAEKSQPAPEAKTEAESNKEPAQPAAESKPAAEPAEPAAESKPAAEKPAEAANDEASQKVLSMEATAYTANCEGCSGVTATGINLKENPDQKVISVDPNVIPLGTKVHVEGYGEAVAGDTGGAIKGNKIDIYMKSQEDAINFGRKTVKVTILD